MSLWSSGTAFALCCLWEPIRRALKGDEPWHGTAYTTTTTDRSEAMAWDETGKARIQRFRAYQELEQKYLAAESQLADLTAEVARKDALIRQLAKELAGLGQVQEPPQETEPRPVVLSSRPPPRKSGQLQLSIKDILTSRTSGSASTEGGDAERKDGTGGE